MVVLAITLLGDVKGCCAPRNTDFTKAEVGHIFDMATDLMTKEQFARTVLFCFLTGFSSLDVLEVRTICSVWRRILLADIFRIIAVEDLGFATFDVPNWRLLNGLGKGRFSFVFSCQSTLTDEVAVLKVFRDSATHHMAFTERMVLTSLMSAGGMNNNNNNNNIPTFRELHTCGGSFNALILTPLGVSVLPCSPTVLADVTPRMIVALLQVVQKAHSLGWIHRDIKPDNILLDQKNYYHSSSRIFLND
eukprot:gene33077-42790_t